MLTFTALPAFNDNYIWLLQDAQRQLCAVVDPGDAQPVLDWLAENPQWQLTDILITHHHHDHVGGVNTLKEATQARVTGPAQETIPSLDIPVDDGATIELLGHTVQVFAVPGHTLGHVVYFCQEAEQTPWLLSGDTLFAGGCGRVFEGTAQQMYTSLTRLAALPDNTRVYCTHEYTLSNLLFAEAVEPNNIELKQRMIEVRQLRDKNLITLPSSIALEKRTNPFLRCEQPEVVTAAEQKAGSSLSNNTAVFATLRSWKDTF
ncbi:MAG TPA: hydroxyacylglutathione hydrolase [Gammaproteobacteria bacterium]|nr:hydroxyacylglutathione hydrolase [Gammaproteobacteria bacterium]